MLPNELPYDAVGLWQIIPACKNRFGLAGAAVSEAARRAITALIKKGAVPIDGVSWEPLNQYGTGPEEIAGNIVAEWEASGVDPSLDGLWFRLPELL